MIDVHIQTTIEALPHERVGDERYEVTIIRDGPIERYELPRDGKLTIGRSRENDLCIPERQVSRHHAVLYGPPSLAIEDLGGTNGTSVSGVLLTPGTRCELRPGQIVDIGAAMLVVQATSAERPPVRLRSHEHFEARLEEECRKASSASSFAVVLVRAERAEDARAIERCLRSGALTIDLVARYADMHYELLLANVTQQRLEQFVDALIAAIGETIGTLSTGRARFPADGRTAHALLGAARQRARGDDAGSDAPIIRSSAMIDLMRVAQRVAQGRISVLLLGETGVGKEIAATAIHRSSPRADKAYVRLNCGALNENLLENELFGHEKGAFTGADVAKPGLLELADGGTIFLDEVGELHPSTQVKLLRVLEQREVLRVGGLEPRSIDVRFIAATNRDLEEEIVKGTFRQDLFFRLNGAALRIPPLRERREEIEPLALQFVVEAARENGDDGPPSIAAEVLELLRCYDWPGNIRELRNMIERAVLLADDEILPRHLPLEKMSATWLPPPAPATPISFRLPASATPPGLSEDELEERLRAIEALEACNGNQTHAAKHLGVSRRTLVKRIIKYGLPRPRKR